MQAFEDKFTEIKNEISFKNRQGWHGFRIYWNWGLNAKKRSGVSHDKPLPHYNHELNY